MRQCLRTLASHRYVNWWWEARSGISSLWCSAQTRGVEHRLKYFKYYSLDVHCGVSFWRFTMERHSEALLWTPESEASRSEVLQSKYYTPEYSRAYYTGLLRSAHRVSPPVSVLMRSPEHIDFCQTLIRSGFVLAKRQTPFCFQPIHKLRSPQKESRISSGLLRTVRQIKATAFTAEVRQEVLSKQLEKDASV